MRDTVPRNEACPQVCGQKCGQMAKTHLLQRKTKSATSLIASGCGFDWWTIRGSNTVDNFKQIAEIVEKKGAGIVYRVISAQMYPEVYPIKISAKL